MTEQSVADSARVVKCAWCQGETPKDEDCIYCEENPQPRCWAHGCLRVATTAYREHAFCASHALDAHPILAMGAEAYAEAEDRSYRYDVERWGAL